MGDEYENLSISSQQPALPPKQKKQQPVNNRSGLTNSQHAETHLETFQQCLTPSPQTDDYESLSLDNIMAGMMAAVAEFPNSPSTAVHSVDNQTASVSTQNPALPKDPPDYASCVVDMDETRLQEIRRWLSDSGAEDQVSRNVDTQSTLNTSIEPLYDNIGAIENTTAKKQSPPLQKEEPSAKAQSPRQPLVSHVANDSRKPKPKPRQSINKRNENKTRQTSGTFQTESAANCQALPKPKPRRRDPPNSGLNVVSEETTLNLSKSVDSANNSKQQVSLSSMENEDNMISGGAPLPTYTTELYPPISTPPPSERKNNQVTPLRKSKLSVSTSAEPRTSPTQTGRKSSLPASPTAVQPLPLVPLEKTKSRLPNPASKSESISSKSTPTDQQPPKTGLKEPLKPVRTSRKQANQNPEQASIAVSKTEPLYDNTAKNVERYDSETQCVIGIPLPTEEQSGDSSTLTPLDKDGFDLLDPTSYVSLWEMRTKGLLPSTDKCVEELASDESDLYEDPPMPGFAPPPLPTAQEVSGISILPPKLPKKKGSKNSREPASPLLTAGSGLSSFGKSDVPRRGRDSVSDISADQFRLSYMPTLDDDPFAGEVDLFNFEPFPAPKPSACSREQTQSPNVMEVTVKKLIPSRSAPAPPTSPRTGSPNSGPIYAEINKKSARNHSEDSQDSVYYLANDTTPDPEDHCFDNAACVSYDSEETIEEDCSDENPSPPHTPSNVPVRAVTRANHAVRTGYLYKQGGKSNNKGWNKRYVTFDGQKLKYFSSQKSRISKRIIPVSSMKHVESDVKQGDSGRFRFKLQTKFGRMYVFAAETLDDYKLWSSALMKAIIEHGKANPRGGGTLRGGDMHSPDREGTIRMDDIKRYVAIKNGTLCYYNNQDDFQFATAIHEISMETSSVKDIGKCKLQLTTPYHQYILTCDGESDLESWKISLEESIAAALSDDNVLNELYCNDSNRVCADCNSKDPHWAVLHLVVLVCSRCAGVHRQYWPFKVKSVRMDFRIWSEDLIKLYVTIGNKVANSIWEADLHNYNEKITPSSDQSKRKLYIIKKYQKKLYFKKFDHQKPQSALNEALLKTVQKNDLSKTMQLVNSGAIVLAQDQLNRTASELAKQHHQHEQLEYLKYNGAEGESFSDIWAVMNKQLTAGSDETHILKTGFLYKMHGTKKSTDYPKQWVILSKSTIKFFDDELDAEPKEQILIRTILSLSKHNNERGEPSFELLSVAGTTFIYGAGLWDDIYTWMSELYKVLVPVKARNQYLDFTKASYVHSKEGTLGAWKWCWLYLKNKELSLHDADEDHHEDIDLRKVLKIDMVSSEDMAVPAKETGQCMVLNLPNKALYIQSDLRRETESWHAVLDISRKESSHNLEDQQLNKQNVPVLISKCLEFVFLNGMDAEGIYRLSGTHSKVSLLLSEFLASARSVHIKTEEYSVHDVANVLKRYLRNLQDPLMKTSLYGKWLGTANDPDHTSKLYTYKSTLSELPPVNYATLELIIGHLCRVTDNQDTNKMHKINLATVFGPVLLSGSSAETSAQLKFQNTGYEIQVVVDLIEYYQWLFEVDNSKLEIEQKMQRKIKEINEGSPQSARSSGFILGIYMFNKLDEPVNMKVSSAMTSAGLLRQLHEMKRIPRVDGYGLFEIVCDGDLERPLGEEEKVLGATLAWAEWNQEHCKGNYLCVKDDYVSDGFDQVIGPDISRFTELPYCEKKSWKKMYFGFNQSHLTVSKDRSDSKHIEWHADDIRIYIGTERKRKPPTRFSMTLLIRSEDSSTKTRDTGYLGHSVCFNSQDELFTWMGAIHYAQSIGADNSQSVASPRTPSGSSPHMFDKKNAKIRLPSIRNPFKKAPS